MDYLELNRKAWDRRTAIHAKSSFYNVDGFLGGHTSLQEIELAELAPVAGRSLLHLQCHFGLDTLSWARMGAVATGVDLSPVAIEEARRIMRRAGLEAQFICSDVYAYGESSKHTFDIVYTSYGAICWLPDIDAWAETVSGKLKQGGTFYMVEFHPLYDLHSGYAYFHDGAPDVEDETTYTENAGAETMTTAVWTHPLGSVINALIRAGIRIDHVNEFPYSPYNCFEGMEELQPGRFYITRSGQQLPLLYSIKGTKTGA